MRLDSKQTWNGKVVLENVVINAKAINNMKLPIKLAYGRIGRLELIIPWKSNFSSPTVVNIEDVQILVKILDKPNWEGIDFDTFEYKIPKMEEIFASTIESLKLVNP